MKVPVSWIVEYVPLAEEVTADEIAHRLTFAGLEVVGIDRTGEGVSGPLVVGRVASFEEEPQKNGKVIRWCQIDVGDHNPDGETSRGIICGASNFAADDYVVVALPGATLAGGFAITERKTYGHLSQGMLCASDEIGLGTDHSGIIVLGNLHEGRALIPGEPAAPILMLHDQVLDIDLTPDLGYCQSVRGVAREISQAFSTSFLDPVRLRPPREKSEGYPVLLESQRCDHFVALNIAGIDPNTATPAAMVRRLDQCGMRPISLAVDVTNYVMLEFGQPLHAYDADQVEGPIVVRQAFAGEKLTTLDGVERMLDPEDLIIADAAGPLGIAGVMGGARGEVGPETTNVIIEAAHFADFTVARSSRRHHLSTEASRRFERGIDPQATYAAATRAATLIASLSGGQQNSAETVLGVPHTPATISMGAQVPREVLGYDIPIEQILDALHGSGTKVTAFGDALTLTAPSWRPDLRDPQDFVEEIARKTGFDKVPSRIPPAPAGRGRTREQQLRRDCGVALAGAGLVEVMTLPFMSDQHLDAMQIISEDIRHQSVRLVNPLTEEQPHLRTTLLPGLVDALLRNLSRSAEDVAIFEIGRVFRQTAMSAQMAAPLPGAKNRPTQDELDLFARSLPAQPRLVAGLLTGTWRRGLGAKPVAAGWQQALQAAMVVGRVYGVELTRSPAPIPPWHPGRCAELQARGAIVGYAGELHPNVCQQLGIPAGAAAFEIDLDGLLSAAPLDGSVPVISQHPVVKEDVALIVDATMPAQDVAEALKDGGGHLLESLALFDVYVGDQVPEGKKSLAYALRFRSVERTLKQEEATAAKDAAVATAAQRCGAVQRV